MDISEIVGARLSAWMTSNSSLNTIKKVQAKSAVGFGTIRRAKNGSGNITVDLPAATKQAVDQHISRAIESLKDEQQ